MMRNLRGSTIALAACVVLCTGERLPAGVGPIRFDNNTPTTIPDLTTIEIPFPVGGITGVEKVTASFHLTHSFDGDLTISLVSPDDTVLALSVQNGGQTTPPQPSLPGV